MGVVSVAMSSLLRPEQSCSCQCLERAFACGSGIKQHFHGFSRFEGVFDDLCPVRIHLRIMFSVSRDGDNAGNVLRVNLPDMISFKSSALPPWAKPASVQRQRRSAMLICFISIFYAYLFPSFFWGTNIQQREDLSKQWADLFFLNRKSPSCSLGAKQGRTSVTHR